MIMKKYFEDFSVPELNLMCIYDTSSRENLLKSLNEGLKDTYDSEMIELFELVIEKLRKTDDTVFSEIGFYFAEIFEHDSE